MDIVIEDRIQMLFVPLTKGPYGPYDELAQSIKIKNPKAIVIIGAPNDAGFDPEWVDAVLPINSLKILAMRRYLGHLLLAGCSREVITLAADQFREEHMRNCVPLLQ